MPKLRGSQAVEFSVLSLPGWTVERGRSDTHRSEAARREPVSFSRAGKGLWKSKPGKRYRIAIEGGWCKICFTPAATSSAQDAHFRQYRILREEGWEIRDGWGVCKDKVSGQNERKSLSNLRSSFAASSSKKIRRLLDRGYAFCRRGTCLLPYRSSDHCIGTVALDKASDVLALSGVLGRY